MRARAAILTMIGLARTQPISRPCRPGSNEPNSRPTRRPGPKPSQLEARMNTIAVAPTVAPSAKDMMLPHGNERHADRHAADERHGCKQRQDARPGEKAG